MFRVAFFFRPNPKVFAQSAVNITMMSAAEFLMSFGLKIAELNELGPLFFPSRRGEDEERQQHQGSEPFGCLPVR